MRGCPGARPNHAFLEHCCAVIEQCCCPRAFLIQRCDAYVTIAAHLEDVVEKPVGVKVVGVDRELVQVALAQFGEVVEAAPKAAAQVSLHERVDDDQELRPINASSAPDFVSSLHASHEAQLAPNKAPNKTSTRGAPASSSTLTKRLRTVMTNTYI